MYGAIWAQRNISFKKWNFKKARIYLMKEAKTVLIGSIQNEGELVRKDQHQSLFSKLKKSILLTNAFHHQSLFSNQKKSPDVF